MLAHPYATHFPHLNTDQQPARVIELEPPLVRLVFDHVDGVYRCALYRHTGDGSKRKLERNTAKAPKLYDALRGVFSEVTLRERTQQIYEYIRATPWGAGME